MNVPQPFICRELINDVDKEKFYKLRYQEYVGRGWELPNPEGLEKDGYEKFSYVFGVLHASDDRLITALRLICGRSVELPLKAHIAYVDESISDNGLEISRYVFNKENLSSENRMLVRRMLFYAIYDFGKSNYYDFLYAIVTPKLLKILHSENMTFFIPIGREFDFKNGINLPIKADLANLVFNV